jgi:16S rRNA (cytosine1402-N4)-methyltransferase
MQINNQVYHQPVLLQECIDGLAIKPDGLYIDMTFGGGGHSKAILNKLNGGKLFAFDQDADAKENANQINNPAFTFIEANFRYARRYLKLHGVQQVDGILADLGVSSHQIDSPQRGFSTRFQADLDMRMDQQGTLTAKTIVNTYTEEGLHKILGMYGEVKNAKTLAASIVKERFSKPLHTVNDLKNILNKFAPRGRENKYYAQVFQALRIEVNEELKVLEELLEQSAVFLKPGGRLVILSYHSLEDRLVKNFINKGKFSGEPEKDMYGNLQVPFRPVNKKPLEASEEEIARNNRARSAKLRIGEKI